MNRFLYLYHTNAVGDDRSDRLGSDDRGHTQLPDLSFVQFRYLSIVISLLLTSRCSEIVRLFILPTIYIFTKNK